MSELTQGNRLTSLDIGRTVAILGVISAHLYPWVPNLPYWLLLLAKSGQYGVQLFFVISAFTICKTLSDDNRNGYETATIIRRFYVKRVARIAPLYYLGIVAYGVLDLIARRADGAHVLSDHGIFDVVANVLFIHAFVPTAINSVVPGGWSIGVEMTFYALAPAIFLLTRTKQALWFITISILGICLAAVFFALRATGANAIVNDRFLYFWPPTQLPCFILGLLVWNYYQGKFIVERARPKTMLICALSVVLGYTALLFFGVGMNRSHAIAPIVAAATGAALLMLFATSPDALRRFELARKIGERSYGVYIWHFIGIFIFRIISKIWGPHLPSILAFLFGMVFVSTFAYVLSIFSEHMIETPISRWARLKLLSGMAHTAAPRTRPTTVAAAD